MPQGSGARARRYRSVDLETPVMLRTRNIGLCLSFPRLPESFVPILEENAEIFLHVDVSPYSITHHFVSSNFASFFFFFLHNLIRSRNSIRRLRFYREVSRALRFSQWRRKLYEHEPEIVIRTQNYGPMPESDTACAV